MSLLDSMKYGRRSMSSFTREEIMQIRNTPRADHTFLREESARVLERMRLAREAREAEKRKENAGSQE